jgi:hypothetical protein
VRLIGAPARTTCSPLLTGNHVQRYAQLLMSSRNRAVCEVCGAVLGGLLVGHLCIVEIRTERSQPKPVADQQFVVISAPRRVELLRNEEHEEHRRLSGAEDVSKGAAPAMTSRTITLDLLEEICTLSLGPYREGLSLRPGTRAVIERTPLSPSGIPFRSVVCTIDQARDLYDYFRSGAAALSTIEDPNAMAYARGFDNTQHAFLMAGISPLG